MIEAPNYTAEFKAEVIKALLFNIAVTSEFSSRYGVPPVQVRRWIRETAKHLDEIFEDVEQSAAAQAAQVSRLSPGELDALLHDYEQSSATQ
ncbi:MAG: transposase [Desulfovibrionaceae bacterium]|nr:transposase [Desulfovibrionaceae bacterium]